MDAVEGDVLARVEPLHLPEEGVRIGQLLRHVPEERCVIRARGDVLRKPPELLESPVRPEGLAGVPHDQEPVGGSVQDRLEEGLRFDQFADVGDRHANDRLLVPVRMALADDLGVEGGAIAQAKCEREGSRLLPAEQGSEEQVPSVRVAQRDVSHEGMPEETLSIHAEPRRRVQVRCDDAALLVEGEVADRGEVVEIHVLLVRLLDLVLIAAQLLVLHLQLDLMDLELVQEIGGGLAHRSGLGAESKSRLRLRPQLRAVIRDGLPGQATPPGGVGASPLVRLSHFQNTGAPREGTRPKRGRAAPYGPNRTKRAAMAQTAIARITR